MKKTAQQKAIDNRANQLNPNNPAYHKSRMSSNNNRKNQQKVIVIHHNHTSKKNASDQTRVCPLCGCRGRLLATGAHGFGKAELYCRSCEGKFFVKI